MEKVKHEKLHPALEQLCDESVAAKVKPGPLSSLFGFAATLQAVTPKANPKNTVLVMTPRVRRAIIKGFKKVKKGVKKGKRRK